MHLVRRLSLSAAQSLAAVALLFAADARAEVSLPAVFGSHMVLQRDVPIPVWGWAVPGEEVTVTLGTASAKAKADADGGWRVELPALTVGKDPHTLTVAAGNTIQLDDILVGDVWLGSGQSNMEWGLAASGNAKENIAAADHPRLRLLHVPKVQSQTARYRIVNAQWKVCTPQAVPAFSAVLYHFGVAIQKELDVPVGLIAAAWGGAAIEPFTIHDGKSGGIYNGLIGPLAPFPIRGVLWYQGETNTIAKNGFDYLGKMERLVGGWRSAWARPDLPFYFVQIAPWSGERYAPGELPKLWEAQTAALAIPHTGMVVTTDLVDNLADIHPRNKHDVGGRLARVALAKAYGKPGIVHSGPLYTSQRVEGGGIRISFAHAAGLASRDGKPLAEFEIAGADKNYVPATATINGETVVVSAPGVAAPQFVRFGWRNTAQPNLVNAAGLPAGPFQTDGWRGVTGE